MAHKVVAALVAVKNKAGTLSYFYQGSVVPDGFDADDLERLSEAGLVAVEEVTPEFPEGDPSEAWTAKQLKAFAANAGVDLGDAKTKPEILERLS